MNGNGCKPLGRDIGDDCVYGINDVSKLLGTCPVTASKIIDETGKAITIRRKKYVLRSSLMEYLHKKEAANA